VAQDKDNKSAGGQPAGKLTRRGLLGTLGASSVAPLIGTAQAAEPQPAAPSAARPSQATALRETAPVAPGHAGAGSGRPASDYMVDVLRSLDLAYVTANPSSSLRGLHESIINYGRNRKPELLTVNHEEIGVAMAHGYFKACGRPMATMLHAAVGTQHAAMAVYNAWCDRVPVVVISGNEADASHRPPGVPTVHAVQDGNALLRDFTKWDDAPVSAAHFGQSMVRAYKLAMTPPCEPVALSLDAGLQESFVPEDGHLAIPRYVATAPPQGDANAVREAARWLAAADKPVIVVDRAARTPAGIQRLIELAETLNAPVIDLRSRMNFPNTHFLNQSARRRELLSQADVIIGMELNDFWGVVNAFVDNRDKLQERVARNDVKLVSIACADFYLKSNYQDFQRFQPVDLPIAGDAEATLPALTEAVRQALTPADRARIAARAEPLRAAYRASAARLKVAASQGWNATPISVPRLTTELYQAIAGTDWSFLGMDSGQSFWPSRSWPIERHYHHLGNSGGYGLGYSLPAAVGAALANRKEGRLTVAVVGDGDLLYTPSALWSAANLQLPLLIVVHNNRAYHQEAMHLRRISNLRGRAPLIRAEVDDFAPVGTSTMHPNVDFAKLAASMGVWSAGPVQEPAQLAGVLQRAVEVTRSGAPALVDVVTQPR
jgi:thiamine pyrophosphate-dependent acetolactate synthase large subunit-like protein